MRLFYRGIAGAENLAKDKRLADILKEMNAQGKLICAICASPAYVLAPLGILEGQKSYLLSGFGKHAACANRIYQRKVLFVTKILLPDRDRLMLLHFR